jgi:coenzyme F420 hydrogenase subunit beta
MNTTLEKSSWTSDIVTSCRCTGCGLCQSLTGNNIVVDIDVLGYYRPVSSNPVSSDNRKLLNTICPGCYIGHSSRDLKDHYDPIWGPLIRARLGYATDEEIRYVGSSGGVISALALYLLQSGKVDYILQTVASTSNTLINTVQQSRSRVEILAASGSRYLPSAPLIDIDGYLAQPGRFAFVGKPCDVAALHNYARVNPRIREKVPYKISFLCAGVPSRKGTLALLRELGLSEDGVKSLRYRGKGWPGSMKVDTEREQEYSMDYDRSWGYLSKFLQFRCKICPDGVGEFADIACGDAWFLKDGKPDFSEREGRSAILSRTLAGERLILDCVQACALHVEPFEISELSLMQPYQATRKKMVPSRLLALKVLGVPIPKYENLQIKVAARQAGILQKSMSFCGTFLRVLLQASYETPQLHGFWKVISKVLGQIINKVRN